MKTNCKLLNYVVAALLIFSTHARSASPNAQFGTAVGGVSRLLYVTDPKGVSVYDINDGHKLLRKLEAGNSGDYKGIAASPALGKLYLTSYKDDDLICMDLRSEKIDWRKHLGNYADSMAMTPDGLRMYLPFRNESKLSTEKTTTFIPSRTR